MSKIFQAHTKHYSHAAGHKDLGTAVFTKQASTTPVS